MLGSYVLALTSGHQPPRTLYYRETATGWCCTEQRSLATRFRTQNEALARWLSKHRCLEDFQPAIGTGQVRAEPYAMPRLWA